MVNQKKTSSRRFLMKNIRMLCHWMYSNECVVRFLRTALPFLESYKGEY